MGNDEGQEDEGPVFPWLPPDDRLWRHPSEVGPQPPTPSPGPVGAQGHVWTVAVAAGIVGALVASAVLIAVGSMHAHVTTKIVTEPSPRTPTSILANATVPGNATMIWPQVVESLAPSIVAVSTSVGGSQGESGSGVVFAAGPKVTDIITAYDLVSGGGAINVSFNGGQSQQAKLVGKDPTTGIAVVSVASAGHVQPAFGLVSELSPAQDVLFMGASENASNYTPGDISGLDQAVTDQNDSTLVGMMGIGGGPVSPTTDGGAIVDQAGWVVGIYSLAASGGSSNQDVSYAVPMDTAMRVAELLMAGQKNPTHPWLGIASATDVSTATTAHPGQAAGALIGSICADTPASRAGLKEDDLVTAVAGRPVKSSASLVAITDNTRVGQSVKVSYHTPQGRSLTSALHVVNEPADLAC